jgi:hypothetical protein
LLFRKNMPLTRRHSIFAGLAALTLLGCGEGLTSSPDIQQVSGDVSAYGSPPDAATTIAFEDLADDVGTRANTMTRTLIRSASAYASFFGHAPPAAVDFSTEWVMFYATGSQPTDGIQAHFNVLLRVGSSLIAVTQFLSPGVSCTVQKVTTAPYDLIKFPAQPGSSAQFFKDDLAINCSGGSKCGPVCDIYCQYGNVVDANGCPTCQCNPTPPDPCSTVKCAGGTHCDSGKCLPDGVSCGGLAGKPCPGSGQCADDPYDSCDPAAGGADCPGICSCIQTVACPANTMFNSDPSVCACVTPPPDPCSTVKCSGGTHCDSGKCIPDGVACGGLAGTPCPGGGKCGDDPYDSCDPAAGGLDCPGICSCVQSVACPANTMFNSDPSVCSCVPAAPDPCATANCSAGTHCDYGKCVPDGVACGGFAGTPCPGGGKCGDDPYDSCDPAAGGADCPGVCSCVQSVACPANTMFDSDPAVCACVSAANPCPPEKCPSPAPLVPTVECGDGSTAGPVCMLISNSCAWAITNCAGS